MLAPAVFGLVCLFSFRYAYYGYPLPNTYYLKVIGWRDRWSSGLGGYGLRLVAGYGWVLALGFWGLVRTSTPGLARALAASVLLQVGYCLYIGGDIFRELRFFAPVVPLADACAVAALRRALAPGRLAAASAGQLLLLATFPAVTPQGPLGVLPPDGRFFESNLALAQLFRENVLAGSLSTLYPAGTVPYYASHLSYVDVFGKTDAHIAHLARYEGGAIGHNKFDFDYVYRERRPDLAFVLLSCDVIDEYMRASPGERLLLRERASRGDTPARFADIEHPLFQRDYYPNRVRYQRAPSPTPLECVFVRSGAVIPLIWSVPASLQARAPAAN